MYTYVPRVRREDHRRRGDKPSMEIIDHRKRLNNRIISKSVPTADTGYDEEVEDTRFSWFDAELGYKKRIKELEKDGEEMALALQEALAENRSLKNNINRGPSRTDVKKLVNEKKTMQNVIEKLGEENFELNEMLNRVIKRSDSEWQDAYENIRRRQEERYSVIGPFLARIEGLKKRTVTMNDGPELNKDRYDAHLTNLEKETQALLNRLRQLKREKRFIDYSFVTGERKCFQNLKEFKEVGGNINRDIQKYTSHFEQLSEKHVEMINSIQESRGLCDAEVQTDLETETEPQFPEVIEKTVKNSSVKLPPIQVNDKRTIDRKRQTVEATAKEGLVERQRTITKMNDVKNKKTNDNKIETSGKTYSPGSDKIKVNDESTTSAPKTTNKSTNNTSPSDIEKKLMANQPVKKPPEDAGSIDMARLVSRTLVKGPHR